MDVSQYVGIFISEAKENLQRLSECLLSLEQQASKATLDEIFRIAHTIKGMAATLNFDNISTLTHQMENLLDLMRRGKKEVNQDIIDVLFKCLDTLEQLVDNVSTGSAEEISTAELIEELRTFTTSGSVPKEAEPEVTKAHVVEGDWEIDWGSKYTEEESKVIAVAAKEMKKCYEVRISLEEKCQMKGARVLLILMQIREVGQVIKAFPEEKDLMEEKFKDKFTVTVITDLELEEMSDKVLSISDVADVKIFNLLGETDQSFPAFVEDTAQVEFVLPQFTDYEQNLVIEARKQGFSILALGVYLLPGVLMKAARVTVIMRAIEQVGEIIKTDPIIEDLEEEKFGNYFEVVLVTNESAESIMDIVMGIAEVRDYLKMAHITTDDVSDKIDQNVKASPIKEPLIMTDTLKQDSKTIKETLEIIDSAHQIADKELNAIKSRTKQDEPVKEPKQEHKREEKPPEAKPDKPKEKAIKPATVQQQTPIAGKLNKFTHTVRVDTEKLDSLMALVGELVITRTHLSQIAFESHSPPIKQAVDKLTNIVNDLQSVTMKLRMVPIEQVFSRFPRTIRDLSKMLNKEIELLIEGEETELDRTLIDELAEPLMHLIRNSADHGLESTAERIKLNKPAKGTIRLKAQHEGNQVFIVVEDDGKGLDVDKIRRKAVEKGIINLDQLDKFDDKAIKELIMKPGFSTSENVSDISGRGVGLDAVKSKIASLGGTIEIASEVNKGSTFKIKLPLTLAIMQALLTEVGEEIYAIPLAYVEEAKIFTLNEIKTIHGTEVAIIRDYTLSIIHLSKLFEVDTTGYEKDSYYIVVIKVGDKKVGLIVDTLIGQSDIVIKPLSKILNKNSYISGAATLGDGRISMILNATALV